MINAVTRVKT